MSTGILSTRAGREPGGGPRGCFDVGLRCRRAVIAALVVSAVLAANWGGDGVRAASPPIGSRTLTEPPGHLQPGLQEDAVDLAFASQKVGWLAVRRAAATGTRTTTTEVLGTADGGARWRVEWAGPGSPEQLVAVGAGYAFLISYPRPGCAADAPGSCATKLLSTQVLATRNGGKSWEQVWASAAQLSDVAWAGPELGVGSLVGRPCPDEPAPSTGQFPQCTGRVARTTDGGHHWSAVLRTTGPVLAVANAGERRWWVVQGVIAPATKPMAGRGGLVVWASADGGATWSRRGEIASPLLSALSSQAEATLTADGAGELWLGLVDRGSCAMHGCGTVGEWYSGTAGRTWVVAPLAAASSPGCGPDAYLPMASAIGGGEYIATSVNLAACSPPASTLARWGGPGWRSVHQFALAPVTAISWPSASTGYVVAGGALARTTDGGRTWSQAWPPVAPLGPLAPVGAKVAVAAGDAIDPGVVMRTSNGGATWGPIADLPGDITQIAFPAARYGFLVLLNPERGTWELEASTDGGYRWARRGALPRREGPAQSPEGVSGLWMESPRRGLVLMTTGASVYGLDGVAPATLWSTSNGGPTWARAATVPTSPFWVLAAAGFARARSGEWWGLVEGGQGGPETTPDGGREWDSRRSFPALDEVQVLSPRLIVGWQTAQAGFRHTMVMSDDGGGRWLRRPLPEVVYTSVFGASYDLAFVNARDGWWSAGGQVWTTSDGGLRWWP